MKDLSATWRTVLAIFALVIGLFLIGVAPIIVQRSLDPVLAELMVVAQERPQYLSGLTLFTFFFPLWRALSFVGGVTLLVSIPALYKGEEWTLPVTLTAYAMPSIGGMFMFLPYVSWVEGAFPLPMIISWVGLLGFWGTLLIRKGDRLQKLADWLVFTFMGMLATHSFVLGVGAARQLMTRPGQPLYEGVQWWILSMIGHIDWIGAAMLIIAIPLLALRKKTGWYLTLIAAISILAIDAPTQLIRTNTLDYLYGSLLAAGLILWLVIPAFKRRLIGAAAPADDPSARAVHLETTPQAG